MPVTLLSNVIQDFFVLKDRLQLCIDCETITRDGTKEGASVALPGQPELEAVVRELGVAPITPSQSEAVGRKRKLVGNGHAPSSQDVLNSIASKCFKTVDPSNPDELNGFVVYLEKVRKVLVIEAAKGSLIVTVECSSLEIVDELWQDYCSGYLGEMAQKFLVTGDILEELGLVHVKLKTRIVNAEYRACRQYFLKRQGEYVKC